MKLQEMINTEVLKQNSIDAPINVKITGDEEMHIISWHNLSNDDITAIREYTETIPDTAMEQASWRSRTRFLDEDRYNTRNGYAKEGNTGHANTKALLDALTTQQSIKDAARDRINYSDKLFAAEFFGTLYSTEDIGPDTISDFVTWVMRNRLKEYTKQVWNLQSDEFKGAHPLHEEDNTILIDGMNVLCLPESLQKREGIKTLANGTPLAIIKVVSVAHVEIIDKLEWEYNKSSSSATSVLTRIINIISKEKNNHETWESLKTALPQTPAALEIIGLVDINSIVKAIFNN